MYSTNFSLSGLTAEAMQNGSTTILENNYLTMKADRFFAELEKSNALAEQAGWKNPKEIKPIVYDEKRKCRIV